MTTSHRPLAIASVLCLALSACNNAPDAVLTVEGTYSGTTENNCQVALRNDSTGKLEEAYGLEPSFKQVYTVTQGKGRYYVEVHCPDGKSGMSPAFEFEPPRGGIALRNIELR